MAKDRFPGRASEQTPSGYSSRIQVMPDPFTGEILNIGIAVTDNQGNRSTRVIEWPGRLKCLYGEEQSNILVSLADYAAHAYEEGKDPPAENILISEPKPFYNMSAMEALETLFRDQVTVAVLRNEKGWRKKQMKTKKLRADVYGIIRSRGGIMWPGGLIPDSETTILQSDKGERKVSIPLVAPDGAAGLESADYAPTTVKLRLLDALVDLECAARYKNNIKRLGLFIARSSHDAESTKTLEIDYIIDSIRNRAPDNCTIEVESDLEILTDRIFGWGGLRAA